MTHPWMKFSDLWPPAGYYWCRKFDPMTGNYYSMTVCLIYKDFMDPIGWSSFYREKEEPTVDPLWEYYPEKIKEPA